MATQSSKKDPEIPRTLYDWRRSGWEPEGTVPRDIWTPLEEFFGSQGLTLWKKKGNTEFNKIYTIPPNDTPRAPDGFAYTVKYSGERPPRQASFGQIKAIHCVARTDDSRDILIRLVAKGSAGGNHLAALRRLATGPIAFRGENHTVPLLREIYHEDMTFAIMPLMRGRFNFPWFYDFDEVIDAVIQILEGVTFCHEHLVAHLDIDIDNILINFIEGPSQSIKPDDYGKLTPFRSLFPIRYYLNDFELSVTFDRDSDPSTRKVTGLPTKGILTGRYGRDKAPEMLSEEPYCPFRADVWQLGRMFSRCFGHLGELSTLLVDLFTDMSSDDPLSRPTASEAFKRVLQIKSKLQIETLVLPVPKPPPEPESEPEE